MKAVKNGSSRVKRPESEIFKAPLDPEGSIAIKDFDPVSFAKSRNSKELIDKVNFLTDVIQSLSQHIVIQNKKIENLEVVVRKADPRIVNTVVEASGLFNSK